MTIGGRAMSYDSSGLAPARVIFVQEQRRRQPGWLVGAAVVTLLSSGSTLALWRSSASFTGGQVVTGDLDLTPCNGDGTLKWYDISPDRLDAALDLADPNFGLQFDITQSKFLNPETPADENSLWAQAAEKSFYQYIEDVSAYPESYTNFVQTDEDSNLHFYAHEIEDIDTWAIVPGDTVLAVCDEVVMTLQGDNMVAELSFESDDDDLFDTAGDAVVAYPELFINDTVISRDQFYVGGHLDPNLPNSYSDNVLGYFGGPTAGQAFGTLPAELPDWFHLLETASGTQSTGQANVAALFIIHFVDDGIAEYAALEENDPENNADPFVSAKDITAQKQSRYLAQEALATLSGGRLILRQLREPGSVNFVDPRPTRLVVPGSG